MGKGFRKFKRKLRFGAFLRALLGGLSVGVIVTAAQWLYAKQTLGDVNLIRFAVVGAIPAAALFLVLLIALLPTDKRLARRLDNHLSFEERAQTMIAFRKDESPMAALQRTDTEERLMKTPRRRLKGVQTWLFAVLPVAAALCMAGTILVPAKEPPAEPPVVDTAWYLTPLQQAKLEKLIAEVSESEMEEEVREETVRLLENLLARLKTTHKENEMRDTVVNTILDIHKTVSEYNLYDLVTDKMSSAPSEVVRALGGSLYTLKPLMINEQLKSLCESLLHTEGRGEVTSQAAGALRQSLSQSGTPETYRLRVALAELADRLDAITDESTEEELNAFRTGAEKLLGDAIAPEATNETMEYYTVETLKSIFGIPSEMLPDDLFDKEYDVSTEGDYKPDDDPDKNHAGGLGSGEVLFGSNDTIYDPEKGEYVTYGKVLRRYHATVLEHIGSGSIPEELEDMLHDYFAKLSNGGAQKED